MENKKCLQCHQPFKGRADKKFCSIACKNEYNYKLRKATRNITKEIDKILHRNYEILRTLMPQGKYKTQYDRMVLERAGFQFNYHTSSYVNSRNKRYFYLYDYAWMEFSTREIMIIRKKEKKSKTIL